MIGRMSGSSKIIVSLVLIPLIIGITLLLASIPIYKVILILLAIGATGYLAISSLTQVQGVKVGILEDRNKLLQQENQKYQNRLSLQADIETLKAKRSEISNKISDLEKQESELKSRIIRIRQENSDIDALEDRQRKSEELRVVIEESKGKLRGLQGQVKEYEAQRDSLKGISVQYLQRQEELEQLKDQFSLLNQQVVELELFRSTYDALSQDFQSLEKRKKYLEAEIPRLDQEHNRILGAIRDLESQAWQVQQLKSEINQLEEDKRHHSEELKKTKNVALQLEAEHNLLTVDNETLGRKNEALARQIEDKKAHLSAIKQQIQEDKEEAENNIKVAFQALKAPVSLEAERIRSFDDEYHFLREFKHYLDQKSLVFPGRIIKAFHTSLKVQDISALVILAGISGTGKSELPQAYAEFLGAPLVMLPVQPRWDSPQDLQGFYNYIEKKYKPTELMRYLYQHQHSENLRGRIVMVLLDEMNLARVEYYFSDFLSKLESRRNKPTYLELEAGSLRLEDRDKQVLIPKEFLFVGTMNEDETTQSLSDKVLDRANVLTFGRPQDLKLRGSRNNRPSIPKDYVTWQLFEQWIQEPSPDSALTEKVKDYVDRANSLMEELGRPFAHRVYQAIAKYVANYPGVQTDDNTLNQAIADQFGQKLLPKLRGLVVEDHTVQPYLHQMQLLIDEFGDKALTDAFEKACAGQYGQFQWKGMIYPAD